MRSLSELVAKFEEVDLRLFLRQDFMLIDRNATQMREADLQMFT